MLGRTYAAANPPPSDNARDEESSREIKDSHDIPKPVDLVERDVELGGSWLKKLVGSGLVY